MITSFQKVIYENKEVTKINFKDTDLKEKAFILMPEAKKDILKLKEGSIILPVSVSTRQNTHILNDYKIIKSASEKSEIKKAV